MTIKTAYSAVIEFPDQKITVNLFSATYAAVDLAKKISGEPVEFSATYAAVHLESYQKKPYISTYNSKTPDLPKHSK